MARLAAKFGPKGTPAAGQHQLFGFLTTEANAIVAPIHPRRCRSSSRRRPSSTGGWNRTRSTRLALQRPLPDDALRIVAKGEKEDGVVAAFL